MNPNSGRRVFNRPARNYISRLRTKLWLKAEVARLLHLGRHLPYYVRRRMSLHTIHILNTVRDDIIALRRIVAYLRPRVLHQYAVAA